MNTTCLQWKSFLFRSRSFGTEQKDWNGKREHGFFCYWRFASDDYYWVFEMFNGLKKRYMKINLRNGIDRLLFGMKQQDVVALYGKPTKEYKDEDENIVFMYNTEKLRLTFYAEEDFRLGYIIASDADLEVLETKVIGRKVEDVKRDLAGNGLVKWTQEEFDTFENWFNEENWVILQSEFSDVVKVEVGAIINDKDDFEWKFKK